MAPLQTEGRMIRRAISRSEKVGSLSPFALSLFCLLIPHYNAHGKMQANPFTIKGTVCPHVPFLTVEMIEKCLAEIHHKTNVKWFEHDGQYYLHALNWKEHQDLRRVGKDILPSWPGEEQEKSGSTPGEVQESSGSSPPSEVGSRKLEVEVRRRSTPFAPHAEPKNGSGTEPPRWDKLITWDANDGCFKGITDELLENWKITYPALDIRAKLMVMDDWLKANPTKKKQNYYRFIINWLRRDQERGF